MTQNIKNALKEYGLTDKETQTYLALLPLGSTNLQQIAKKVNLPRTTIYNTLNYLFSKGLISKIIKKNITYYQASNPKKLVNDIEEKKKLLTSILPELESLKNNIKEPSSVQIYEGFKGISTILSQVFEKKQQTYYFGSYTKSLKILKHLPEHIANIRIENKINAKIIIEKTAQKRFIETNYQKFTQIKYLESLKDFPCMIFIFGDKTAIYTLESDIIGIIIKNKEITKAIKIIFNLYWKMAQK